MEVQPIKSVNTEGDLVQAFSPRAMIREQFPVIAAENPWINNELFTGFEQFQWKFRHSLGVTKNVGLIANAMGMTPEATKRLQVAALVHDVVFGTFPRELVNKKTEELTDADRLRIRSHVNQQLLKEALQTMPEEYNDLIEIIALHHTNQPKPYSYVDTTEIPENTLKLVRILAMADQFDALTHKRPYQQKGDIDEEVEVVVSEEQVRSDFMQPERFGKYPQEVDIALGAFYASVAA
jgi:response regulator RpfG family c-di-GMP phosphodiesterase